MRKPLLVVAALCAAGYGVYHWQASHHATPTTQAELVENRLWVDHMPRGERDTVQIFALLGDESIGVFQATSVWRGSYEGFRYEGHGGEVRIVYPQTGDRETLRAKAKACRQDGWDYCLELDGGSRGVKRYFSMRDWEIGSRSEIEAKLSHLTAAETPSSDLSSAHK